MKILLVNPPRTYYTGSKGIRIGLPLGLMYVAAFLEKHDYRPKVFDFLIHPKAKVVETKKGTRHGVAEAEFLKVLQEERPDIVGITNPFTAQLNNALRVAQLVKNVNKKIITIIGGPHLSVKGRELLEQNQSLDVGVLAEGEYPALEIVRTIEEGGSLDSVKGIVYRNSKGEVIQTEFGEYVRQLDDLPYPAYHLIDMDVYFSFLKKGLAARPLNVKRSVSLISSRGCPFDCVFCSIHLHMGRQWRSHSAKYVTDHLEYLVSKYDIKHVSFEDDNFSFNIERSKQILKEIIKRGTKISRDAPNGIRADRLDFELAQLMKKSGCVELCFGIESGDQRVLDEIINKNLKLDSVMKTMEICKKVGIKTKAFFVIGFPGEKMENIKKTADLALKLRKKYGTKSGFLIATPLFGTRLYDICKKKGYLVKEPDVLSLAAASQTWGRGLIKTEDFTPEQLKKAASDFNRKMAQIELLEKIKNPAAYLKSLKFAILHPLKTTKVLIKPFVK